MSKCVNPRAFKTNCHPLTHRYLCLAVSDLLFIFLLAYVAALKGGVKGKGARRRKKRRETGEREGKETPAVRTPHSACKL